MLHATTAEGDCTCNTRHFADTACTAHVVSVMTHQTVAGWDMDSPTSHLLSAWLTDLTPPARDMDSPWLHLLCVSTINAIWIWTELQISVREKCWVTQTFMLTCSSDGWVIHTSWSKCCLCLSVQMLTINVHQYDLPYRSESSAEKVGVNEHFQAS